jgi:hypothetical protein
MKWLILATFLISASVIILLTITMDDILEKIREVKQKRNIKNISAKIEDIMKRGEYYVVSVALYQGSEKTDEIKIKGKEVDPEVIRNKGVYITC